jgi:energy-coupling factor transport system ATP-binding protein
MKEGKIVFQGSRESYLEKGCIPLPPIASMMKELRARGLPVNPAAFTVEDALEEILKLKSAFEKENNGN